MKNNKKKRFVEDGLDVALHGQKGDRVYKKKVDGDLEAKIIATSCSQSPEGFSQWSLRMLAGRWSWVMWMKFLTRRYAKF